MPPARTRPLLGTLLGPLLGPLLGSLLGTLLGPLLGSLLGPPLGPLLGPPLGPLLGPLLGSLLGTLWSRRFLTFRPAPSICCAGCVRWAVDAGDVLLTVAVVVLLLFIAINVWDDDE
jgi:hypothetical protein